MPEFQAAAFIDATTAAVFLVNPDLADTPGAPPSAVAWAYGPWGQIVPPNVLANHALAYLLPKVALPLADGLIFEFQFQLGSGPAGAEVVIGTWRGAATGSASADRFVPFLIPIVPLLRIPANARVAVRFASPQANASTTLKLGFNALPL